MFLKLDKVMSSQKTAQRTRELSPFIKEVMSLGLEKGGYAYASHKKWLSMGGSEQSPASQKNGPRYTLKAKGIDCKAVLLSGEDLKAVAKSEGIELGEKDIIYAMKATEVK